jgi:hypothetical protein
MHANGVRGGRNAALLQEWGTGRGPGHDVPLWYDLFPPNKLLLTLNKDAGFGQLP